MRKRLWNVCRSQLIDHVALAMEAAREIVEEEALGMARALDAHSSVEHVTAPIAIDVGLLALADALL